MSGITNISSLYNDDDLPEVTKINQLYTDLPDVSVIENNPDYNFDMQNQYRLHQQYNNLNMKNQYLLHQQYNNLNMQQQPTYNHDINDVMRHINYFPNNQEDTENISVKLKSLENSINNLYEKYQNKEDYKEDNKEDNKEANNDQCSKYKKLCMILGLSLFILILIIIRLLID